MKVVRGAGTHETPVRGHLCWLADDAAGYVKVAVATLADGALYGDEPVAVGPPGPALVDVAAAGATPGAGS